MITIDIAIVMLALGWVVVTTWVCADLHKRVAQLERENKRCPYARIVREAEGRHEEYPS